MDTLNYKGYSGSVEYCAANDCLVGKVLGMSKDSITYEGSNIKELKADFEAGIDDYIESCREMGIVPRKPYSGSFNVRISQELHGKIAAQALSNGESLNSFVKHALELAIK